MALIAVGGAVALSPSIELVASSNVVAIGPAVAVGRFLSDTTDSDLGGPPFPGGLTVDIEAGRATPPVIDPDKILAEVLEVWV